MTPNRSLAPLPHPAVWFDLGERTQLEIAGRDRAKFLHNLCTNEINSLPSGGGCEAFLLDARGHILFFVLVFNRGESLRIDSAPGVNERLLAHLDRYLIREQVELRDSSPEMSVGLLAGSEAAQHLQRLGATPPEEMYACGDATIAGCSVELRRVRMTVEPGWQMAARRDEMLAVREAFHDAGVRAAPEETFQAARIAAQWPLAGIDITEKNLPQELQREATAVSFRKGCYIGQETVARIDALGHVNKYLVLLQFTQSFPAPGLELRADKQSEADAVATTVVGNVTSSAWAPGLGTAVALAYVKRGHHLPGTVFDSDAGEAILS